MNIKNALSRAQLGSADVGIARGSLSTLAGAGDAVNSDTYARPSDWLTMPTLVDGDQKIVMLVAVYEHDSNFVAFEIKGGNYTVDWGDGNGPQNYSAGTQAENILQWSDYAASTLSERGFRQAMIVVGAQAGQTLTGANMGRTHSGHATGRSTHYLDFVMAGSGFTGANAITFYGTSLSRMLERFRFIGTCNLTRIDASFSGCVSLAVSEISDTSKITTYTSAYQNCMRLIKQPDHDLSVATNVASLYNIAAGFFVAVIDLPNGIDNLSNFIRNSFSIQKIAVNNSSSVTNIFAFPYDCVNLQEFTMSSAESVDNTNFAFHAVPSLGKVLLPGLKIGVDLSGCNLSATALNNFFAGLGVPTSAQTIDVSGNWGAATCDPSIATAKGWTVVTA